MNRQQISQQEIELLEIGLDHFNPGIRHESLQKLQTLAEQNLITISEPKEIANLHCHTFYSFNGYGYSPSHLAWLAKKSGIRWMGIVDFDVLDGVDEFLRACELTGIRGTAGMETRVHIPQFADHEINSPGEPGVAYHMGTGFVSSRVPSSVIPAFDDIRQRAVQRNMQILDTLNDFLSPLSLDYETDILPITPAGYATERHMVMKIAEKSFSSLEDPIRFWQKKLDFPAEEIEIKVKNHISFQNLLRKKLMKRGGKAYVQPNKDSFPTVDEFHKIILAADAIPCSAWLDGTSSGEQEIEKLLDLLMEKGAAALNIIPDRNWNIADKDQKSVKLRELYRIVELAGILDLPILVGTEINSYGQKIVDNFEAPELTPVKDAFIEGANFLYGHTRMEILFGLGFQSEWAKKYLPQRSMRNSFYVKMGKLVPPRLDVGDFKDIINASMTPETVFEIFKEELRNEE